MRDPGHVGMGAATRGRVYSLLAAFLVMLSRDSCGAAPDRLLYNRDVRPILSDNCFACHGPDRNKRQAGLRLDQKESALSRVIVPGHPERSPLVSRISSSTPDLRMPPPAFHKTLSAAQQAVLVRWIREGAPYQAHWAYIPPVKPTVPTVVRPSSNSNGPIDAFLLEGLRRKGLTPALVADRRTLIRRVTLDLIGLPPTPDETNAFLADRSPNAFEKVVDRLLRSPHYGERMAVPWLDLVRYADTVGFHGDQNFNAWAYRDYVIDSYNANKPFDRFTREQLAGDLLPNPTPETRAATCFVRLNMMTREGGAQAKEYLAKYAADRVRTVGMAWLGSTLNCCECHDHKFDPFTTRDFYSMAAFFADIKQWGVYADYGYTPNPELRGYDNDYPFPPEIKVESPYLKRRMATALAAVRKAARDAEPKSPEARAAFDAWKRESATFLDTHSIGWAPIVPSGIEVLDAASVVKPQASVVSAPVGAAHAERDGSLVLTDAAPDTMALRFTPSVSRIATVKLELLPGVDKGATIYRHDGGPETLILHGFLQQGADGKVTPLTFRYARGTPAEPRYDSGFEVVGIQSGWRLGTAHSGEPHRSTWVLDRPLALGANDRLILALNRVKVGRVRLAVSPFAPERPDAEGPGDTLHRALTDASGRSNAEALTAYLLATGANPVSFQRAVAAERDYLDCRGGLTPVMVAQATTPAVTRVLPRGNWQNETGEIVQPAVPHFLPQPPATGARLSRLDLANWLVSPQNPLTARVFVNRIWKQFFGAGLSDTVDDLGAQGEWPSHPELLDWLAVDFREHGWNIKRLVKQVVMSAAYQRASRPTMEMRRVDPGNRLLACQNPRRLDAEFVRDNALAVAGLLTRDLGGPPCKPYQPEGYYANIQFPDRDYIADTDERQWRRGVYMHWQRTFLHPMLANFGAPSREDCIAARTMANTPQQALTLLNDPEFVEAARVFAARLIAEPSRSDADRVERAYTLALCRSPRPVEKKSLLAFLAQVRAAYRARPEDAEQLLKVGYAPAPSRDPVNLAAWTSVCRVVLNLHETITRY